MSTVIDWASKPEPWRSVGLRFCRDLGLTCEAPPHDSIKARREALGLSQRQLGTAAGYGGGGKDAVATVERGRAGPDRIGRILAALDRLEAEAPT